MSSFPLPPLKSHISISKLVENEILLFLKEFKVKHPHLGLTSDEIDILLARFPSIDKKMFNDMFFGKTYAFGNLEMGSERIYYMSDITFALLSTILAYYPKASDSQKLESEILMIKRDKKINQII